MKAIILGAGQGVVRMNEFESYPSCLKTALDGRTIIDWILNSLSQAGINKVVFVGGFHLEKVIKHYPHLIYYINSDWEQTSSLHSLFCAESEMDCPFLVSFSDIVYRPHVIKKLIESNSDISVIVDRDWRSRYENRTKKSLEKAEKVLVKNGTPWVTKITKFIPIDHEIHGEFIGLVYFNKQGIKILRKLYQEIYQDYLNRPFQYSPNIRLALLSDIIQELINRGHKVKAIEIFGDCAELDDPQDLAQFVFGTKGETLERLRPMVRKSKICDQVRFEVDQWNHNRKKWVDQIQDNFPKGNLVIRSSAINEDSWAKSFAGIYRSILNIDSSDSNAIIRAVNEVIESYNHIEGGQEVNANQILVQPQIINVAMSGVLFTRELESRAPYYIINYDDSSARTDTVTSGSEHKNHTYIVYKNSQASLTDWRINKLIEASKELEQLLGHDSLDIEFALTEDRKLFILQVRPIAAIQKIKHVEDDDIYQEVQEIKTFVASLFQRRFNCFGESTVLGVMPDWNPAEIIGVSPRPLSLSLYQYLITNRVWGESRSMIGYNDTFPHPLLVSLGGRPYIDAKMSFNSFLPKGLSPELAERLVNYYINRLKAHPEFHDKIEFEIAATCLTFNFDKFAVKLKKEGFNSRDISSIKESLYVLTANILTEKVHPVEKELEKIRMLKPRRESILFQQEGQTLPQKILYLLNDCIIFGTIPFSILARYAFIGTAFLIALLEKGVLSQDEYDTFYISIETVAGEMVKDLWEVQGEKKKKEEFISKYGHLRPGTYDILSLRYDEQYDLILPDEECPEIMNKIKEQNQTENYSRNNIFSSKKKMHISQLLSEYKFPISPEQLISFITNSIQARELAKFEFTKNLSDALSLLQKFAEENELTREDISYICIDKILSLSTNSPHYSLKKELKDWVKPGQEYYAMSQSLRLPHLITSLEDIENFKQFESQPNFITQNRVCAKSVFLSRTGTDTDLDGKIVIIESADPGYDWIFCRNIAGLITKYGGVASHMAIRTAEFGLAAAIGCGDPLFDRLSHAKTIELNCATSQIRIIE